jgi:transcriptional regulator with XRE-family HTH domain
MEKVTMNSDEARAAFAERVHEEMEAGAFNRRTLAAAAGTDQNRVGEWVAGKRWPRADHLAGLALALNVSVDWLLTGREPPASRRGGRPDNDPALQIARELSRLAPQLRRLADRAKVLSAAGRDD